MRASSTIATALFALAPAVQAVGTASIYNKCSFDVYVWSVSVGVFDGPTKISAKSSTPYSQEYKSVSEGGISLKLSKTTDCDKITQFEYTLDPDTVWYDISNVNCVGEECPFQPNGMYMDSGKDCPTVTCPAGNATCGNAYTKFNDDWASKACSPDSDTTLYLCAESADGSSDDSGSSSDGSGYIGASTPAPSPSSSYAAPTSSSKKHGDDQVAAAAVETPSSSSSSPPPPPSTTLTSSAKPTYKKPTTSAAPTTTSAPPMNVAPIETTVIEYYTAWQTTYVEAHQHKPRTALHPHARRHQHHL